MKDDQQMDLALWRYGIISPLLHRDANDMYLCDLLNILSENSYIHPLDGRHISVSTEAIRKWFYRYNVAVLRPWPISSALTKVSTMCPKRWLMRCLS